MHAIPGIDGGRQKQPPSPLLAFSDVKIRARDEYFMVGSQMRIAVAESPSGQDCDYLQVGCLGDCRGAAQIQKEPDM